MRPKVLLVLGTDNTRMLEAHQRLIHETEGAASVCWPEVSEGQPLPANEQAQAADTALRCSASQVVIVTHSRPFLTRLRVRLAQAGDSFQLFWVSPEDVTYLTISANGSLPLAMEERNFYIFLPAPPSSKHGNPEETLG
jgi:hypothetical protein